MLAAVTRVATRSPGCRKRKCCSPAISSNSARRLLRRCALWRLAATLDRLEALNPTKVVPAAASGLTTPDMIRKGFEETRALPATSSRSQRRALAAGHSLNETYKRTMGTLRPKYGHWVIFEHCMPFDVSRAYDEAKGIDNPRIWTAERDIEMWKALES